MPEKIFNKEELAEEFRKAAQGNNPEPDVEETEDTTEETETEETETEDTEESPDPDEQDALESLELPNLKVVNGEYVYIVDEDDPESTVYKGKTPTEVFENIRKGLRAKDSYIKELKAKGEMETDEEEKPKAKKKPKLDSGSKEYEMPNSQELFKKALDKYGIDPAVVSWNQEQWREYEEQNSVSQATRLQQKIEQAEQEAMSEYNQQTAVVLNNHTLDEEAAQVVDLMVKYDVDEKELDYQEVLDRVHKNKDNFHKNGIRKSGTIVKEAMASIYEILEGRVSKKGSANVNLKIRRSLDKAKKASKATPKGSASSPKPEPKEPVVHKSTKEATRELKEMFRERKGYFAPNK